ncbi:MAG: hypothetical protein ACI8P0_002515 [Planctomycetaceae bacterium]|jgi:hypothetical protein
MPKFRGDLKMPNDQLGRFLPGGDRVMLLDSGVAKYSRRELSNLTQRREVAKIELQNFAASRLCVILYSVVALPP